MASTGVSPSCHRVQAGAGPYRNGLNSAALLASVMTRVTIAAKGLLLWCVFVCVFACSLLCV